VRGLSLTELPQWITGEEGSVVTLSFEGANVRYDTSVVRGAVPALFEELNRLFLAALSLAPSMPSATTEREDGKNGRDSGKIVAEVTAPLSVKQIKHILEAAGVNYSDCTEKKELEELLAKLRATATQKELEELLTKLRATPGMGCARAGADALAGGWRKGDRVRSRIDQKVKNVGEGAVGSVMGPCNDTSVADKEQRVLVDFDNKGLVNVLASYIHGAAALAGGWRKGDCVSSRIDQKVKNVGEGAVGSVVGPCNDTSLAWKEHMSMVGGGICCGSSRVWLLFLV
jgi:hypothetical protein